MGKLPTVRQRKLNNILRRDWYEVVLEERMRGRTLREIAKRFGEIEGIPMHFTTLAVWIINRERADGKRANRKAA